MPVMPPSQGGMAGPNPGPARPSQSEAVRQAHPVELEELGGCCEDGELLAAGERQLIRCLAK